MSGDLFVVRKGEDGWLPNLVAGVSVWRLAPDLNVDELFAGRLLEPEVDGPDTLPDLVEWDLTGLVPLARAMERQPAEVEAAKRDFLERTERAAELFESPAYARFRDAFTLPGLECPEHWFYDPKAKRLRVMRWGARARGIAAKEAKIYGPAELVAAERKRAAAARAEAPRSGRGLRWLGLGGLLLLVAAGAAFVALSSDDRADAREPVPGPEPEPEPEPEPPPEPEAGGAASEPEPAPAPIPSVHRRVYFDVGVHEVGDDQRESLEVVRAHLGAHPRLRVLLVEGHADLRGEEADNMTLSRLRSVAVMRWLETHGVARERLRGSGCSARYHADESSAADLRASRRVEVYILEPPPADGLRRHEGCDPVAW